MLWASLSAYCIHCTYGFWSFCCGRRPILSTEDPHRFKGSIKNQNNTKTMVRGRDIQMARGRYLNHIPGCLQTKTLLRWFLFSLHEKIVIGCVGVCPQTFAAAEQVMCKHVLFSHELHLTLNVCIEMFLWTYSPFTCKILIYIYIYGLWKQSFSLCVAVNCVSIHESYNTEEGKRIKDISAHFSIEYCTTV